jgi:hypothetical protein
MTTGTERLVVTRTIAARPEQIFGILATPSRHHDTEPGDWVRDAVDTAPITGANQMFAMNMYLTQAGGDYVTYNLVDVFDENRAIGWMPGMLDDAGNHSPGGWKWRYDLAPNGDDTDAPSPMTGARRRRSSGTGSAGCPCSRTTILPSRWQP